ncbi:LysR family transcriptional regulator [Gordonia sp. CPCC 205515]|uniref:LysR family transcriptional regulator n=1 Tax=Gordonia sp. CPCC 205515 TaxID=3140791 RepID=UPI003AF34385
MDLNLHLVRCLLAVVDEGHFGRAAQKMFVSTPSLSQQVRKLERQLGAELLDRTTHPVRLTEIGTVFASQARVAIETADRAIGAVESYRRAQENSIRLGFMTASTGPRMRLVLDQLRRRVPDVTVQMIELPWPQQTSAVQSGDVDAAFVRPPVADTTGLVFDVVQHESRVAVLPATHHLAGRRSIGISDLDDEPHVADDDADPQWVKWWACDPRPSGMPVRYGPSVRTMDELLEAVAAGQAVAITGEFVAQTFRNRGVAFIPIDDVEPCPLSLCTRDADKSRVVAELRRALTVVRAEGT